MSALPEGVLAPPEGPLVVAVSGGADSAYLAWALCGRDPQLIHVDHGTQASAALAAAAAQLADALGLPLVTVAIDVAPGGDFETRARERRRRALRDAAGPDAVIATAHHRDDHLETVLGNLARGSGATGLAGMRASTAGWCKPLLALERGEIRRRVAELDLPFADDPTNDDVSIRRNLIRHDLLPSLERLNPGVGNALLRSADHLAADDDALETIAAALQVGRQGDLVTLSPWELRAVPQAVAHRVVRRALRCFHGHPGAAGDVDAVMDVVGGNALRTVVSGGVVVERDGGLVILAAEDARRRGREPWAPVELPVPGRVVAGEHWIAAGDRSGAPVGRRRVRLARDAVGGSSLVRPAQRGDRIDIGGGSKTVADAMREAAVPRNARPLWPVVVARGKIAWLVGVRAAAWAAADGASEAIVFETGAV